MKRLLGIVLALALLMTGTAFAVEATDAPGTPTQDVVLSLTAELLDEENTPYDLTVLPADQLTVDTVTEIYQFVYEQEHRPVRYFPEETQRQIEAMLKDIVDPDVLYMTEFMRLHAAPLDLEEWVGVHGKMVLDVDYQKGQLILVVLGDTSDPENLVWTPVESHVTELGKVEFIMPAELVEAMESEDILFSLLTVRKGRRGGVVTYDEAVVPKDVPSKTAYDINRITRITTQRGTPAEDDFELRIVRETDVIREELARIREHLKSSEEPFEEHPISQWFPQVSQDEIQYLLENHAKAQNRESLDREELMVYDYLPLITVHYKDTYGDVITAFRFATPYKEGQDVVTMLGLPHHEDVEEDETLMKWAVQRAKVLENGEMEIVFDQLALIGMGEETGLMLVLSEPLEEPEE